MTDADAVNIAASSASSRLHPAANTLRAYGAVLAFITLLEKAINVSVKKITAGGVRENGCSTMNCEFASGPADGYIQHSLPQLYINSYLDLRQDLLDYNYLGTY